MDEPVIGNVGNGFRDGRKNGWGIFPTHGQDKWDGNEFGMVSRSGKDHGELRGVPWREAHSVKSIRQVDFEHIDGPPSGVGQQQLTQESLQCAAELHGFEWREWESVCVLVIKTKITDDAGASVVLRDNSKWGDSQVRHLGDSRIWKDRPELFMDKVDHLLLEEVKEFIAGCMGAPGDRSMELLMGPWGSGEVHRGPVNGVVLKQTAGGVMDLVKVGEVGRGSKGPDVTRKIGGGSETVNSIVN